jgi:hypothetical protein
MNGKFCVSDLTYIHFAGGRASSDARRASGAGRLGAPADVRAAMLGGRVGPVGPARTGLNAQEGVLTVRFLTDSPV